MSFMCCMNCMNSMSCMSFFSFMSFMTNDMTGHDMTKGATTLRCLLPCGLLQVLDTSWHTCDSCVQSSGSVL